MRQKFSVVDWRMRWVKAVFGSSRLVDGALGSGRLQLDDSADVGGRVAELGMDGSIVRAGADDVL